MQQSFPLSSEEALEAQETHQLLTHNYFEELGESSRPQIIVKTADSQTHTRRQTHTHKNILQLWVLSLPLGVPLYMHLNTDLLMLSLNSFSVLICPCMCVFVITCLSLFAWKGSICFFTIPQSAVHWTSVTMPPVIQGPPHVPFTLWFWQRCRTYPDLQCKSGKNSLSITITMDN